MAVPAFLRRLAYVLALSACALAPTRATDIEPPSVYLRGEHYALVSARFLVQEAGARATFAVSEQFHGPDEEVPAHITLRVPDWVVAQLSRDEPYLVGYTAYTIDPRSAKVVVVNPAGPLLLTGPGVEPALFRDTPQARARLTAKDTESFGDASHRTAALAGLGSDDGQWQNYFAAELALRREWHAQLDADARARIARFVRNRDAHPVARELLLRAAAGNSAQLGDWWRKAALDVIAHEPVLGHLRAEDRSATLVRTAFDALADASVAVPRDAAARWTVSDSAALAESALLAVRRSEPGLEEVLIRHALDMSLLPAATREFLREHLRRLEIMHAAQRDSARDVPPTH